MFGKELIQQAPRPIERSMVKPTLLLFVSNLRTVKFDPIDILCTWFKIDKDTIFR